MFRWQAKSPSIKGLLHLCKPAGRLFQKCFKLVGLLIGSAAMPKNWRVIVRFSFVHESKGETLRKKLVNVLEEHGLRIRSNDCWESERASPSDAANALSKLLSEMAKASDKRTHRSGELQHAMIYIDRAK